MITSRIVLVALFTTPLVAAADVGAMPTNWNDITSLAAVIIALLYLVVYFVPQSNQRQSDQAVALTKTHGETLDKAITTFTATLDKMHQRADDWNKMRHDDNERMTEGLRFLSAECAKRNAGKS